MVRLLLLRALTPLLVIVAVPIVGGIVSICRRSSKVKKTSGVQEGKASGEGTRGRGSLEVVITEGVLTYLPVSLVLAFCFTPSVSASLFRAWQCIPFAYDEQDERSFLAQDLSVRCDGSPEHSAVVSVAWPFVAVWPIGCVVGYACLLIPCRFMLLDGQQSSPLLRATAFLHRDYKPSFYWCVGTPPCAKPSLLTCAGRSGDRRWEVAALLQRTILTGWLLLVDSELRFLRLLAGLIVTISFLVLLLVCAPYKSKSDYGVAAGVQVLLVGIFIGGIVVRLYEDISRDTIGSPELAYRFLGLRSSEDAVVMMIIVSFAMVILLLLSLSADSYMHVVQQRLMDKWSVCSASRGGSNSLWTSSYAADLLD